MSEFVKGSLVGDYGVDPARVHVVGAGPNVEPGPGEPRVAREKAILFVGRTFVPKGGPALLEAFARVRRRPPRRAALDRLVDRAAGPSPRAPCSTASSAARRSRRSTRGASVFALPTLREAFGLSFLEAMAFALPVVASRIEAIPEIVSDGETGLLVPPPRPRALARAIWRAPRRPGPRSAPRAAGGPRGRAVRLGRVAARMLALRPRARSAGDCARSPRPAGRASHWRLAGAGALHRPVRAPRRARPALRRTVSAGETVVRLHPHPRAAAPRRAARRRRRSRSPSRWSSRASSLPASYGTFKQAWLSPRRSRSSCRWG